MSDVGAINVPADEGPRTYTFTKYVKLILPLDGFVFWVKADLVSESAIFNAARFNAVGLNQPEQQIAAAPTLEVKGSLHYSTELEQVEDHTFTINTVVFTSETEVTPLNAVGPTTLYIGDFDGIRYAFSSRGSYYQQAGIYHYRGRAIYSDMATQIVDKLSGFSGKQVVSNSLPAWLALNDYAPAYGFGNPIIPVFPSYVVTPNLAPPFAAVHILPESTRPLTSAPVLSPRSSHSQLFSDRARITLYGVRNDQALDFVDCVNQYSLDVDAIGIMNMPGVRDDKRAQVELVALSQKKTIEYEVSYYQTRMNDVARQLILQAVPNFDIGDAIAA